MAISLTNARTRVREFLDSDSDSPRWSDTEIDFALGIAFENVLSEYAEKGGNLLTKQLSVTTGSTGTTSLSSYKPLRITNVFQVVGDAKISLAPLSNTAGFTTVNSAVNLLIEYVPESELPASDGDTFDYGNSVNSNVLDGLLVLQAASFLQIKEQKVNQGLERQIALLWDRLKVLHKVPAGGRFPKRNSLTSLSTLDYCWRYTPYTLEIVRN